MTRQRSNDPFERLFGKWRPSLHDVVLTLGRHNFTKKQLVEELGSGAFRAARHLTRMFAKHDIGTASQIRGRTFDWWISQPRVGNECVWLLMSLQGHFDLNPLTWVGGEREDIVTIATLVRREQKSRHGRQKKAS
jgi:hypothetical protein